ncbi:MAG: hypothetical protein QXN55_01475 [Candidatus Nitrosotenuis sp.]
MTDFIYNIGDTVELDFNVNVTGTSVKPAFVRVVFLLPGGNQVSMPAAEVGDKHKAVFHFDPYLFNDDGEFPFRIEVLIGNKLFVPIKKNVVLRKIASKEPKIELPKDEVVNIPDNPFTVEKSAEDSTNFLTVDDVKKRGEEFIEKNPQLKSSAFAKFEQSLSVPKIKPRPEVNYTERLEALRKRAGETKEEIEEVISQPIEEPTQKINVQDEITKLFASIDKISITKTNDVKDIISKLPSFSELEAELQPTKKSLHEEKKLHKSLKVKTEIPFKITKQKIVMK